MTKGILVDYEWCSGCHTCEMACTVELTHKDFPEGHCGVKIHEEGIYQISEDKWTDINMPIFTDQCDLCAERTSKGKLPNCVHHCQALVMEFGTVEELSRKLDKRKKVLFTLD